MFDDCLRHRVEPVVGDRPTPLGPLVLSLVQRHLHGECEILTADRDIVFLRHGPIVAKGH